MRLDSCCEPRLEPSQCSAGAVASSSMLAERTAAALPWSVSSPAYLVGTGGLHCGAHSMGPYVGYLSVLMTERLVTQKRSRTNMRPVTVIVFSSPLLGSNISSLLRVLLEWIDRCSPWLRWGNYMRSGSRDGVTGEYLTVWQPKFSWVY